MGKLQVKYWGTIPLLSNRTHAYRRLYVFNDAKVHVATMSEDKSKL